jgi:hypothetical protein
MTMPRVQAIFESYWSNGRVDPKPATCSDYTIRVRNNNRWRSIYAVRDRIGSICDLASHHLDPQQQLSGDSIRAHERN